MKRFLGITICLLCIVFLFGSCTTTKAIPTLTQVVPTPTTDTFPYPEEKTGKRCGLTMQDYVSKDSKSETIKALARGEEKVIVAYGTSLTQYEGWVTDLKTIFKFKYGETATIINSGQGATDSNWGKENIKERVTQYVPDMVILEFSMNDALTGRNISPEKGKENLMCMIEEIKKVNPNCEFVLMTMNLPIGTEADLRPKLENYYDVYRKTTQEEGFFFVDNVVTWKELLAQGEAVYLKNVPDTVHPTIAAHRKVTLKNLMNVLY